MKGQGDAVLQKSAPIIQRKRTIKEKTKKLLQNYDLYLLLLPTLLYFLVFHYFPMYGVQIAFKNFNATLGIMGSPWIGFEQFTRFFQSYQF